MKRKLWTGLWVAALLLAVSAARAEAPAYRDARTMWAALPSDPAPISLRASAYAACDMPELSVLDDGTLYTGGSGWVEYEVTAPETALYTVMLRYFPGEGSGGDILRRLTVNGETPFTEAGELSFSRMWNDKNRDYKTAKGNQPIPSQIETPEWRTVYLRDAMGYAVEPLLFPLKAGTNTVRIESISEGMILDTITFGPRQALPPYADYIARLTEGGAARAKTAPVKIQAEDAALKSSPSFYPMNDRTSPLSEPYHPTYITLNSIGASAWNEPGEWIAWDVDAPEDGLYRIAFRYKQSERRGMYAARQLSVNGAIPFAEAADIRFPFGTSFRFETVGDGLEDYWFYLSKGVNRIELNVTLGAMGGVLRDIEGIIDALNALYRDVAAITGSVPDPYRDYQIFKRVPGLMRSLTEQRAALSNAYDALTALTGAGSERTAGITRLIAVIDDMLRGDSAVVVKRLASFKECITAIGKSTLDLKDQPLRIDYLIVAGEDMPDVRADGNFFENAGHTFASFFGSFYNDYNVIQSAVQGQAKEISIWLSTGRDQFDVVRRLINESFEPEKGVKVNLKLINPDVLLPSTFTGVGPDVAIQIGNSAPVNFAFRGAAYDLTQFDDFEAVAAEFLPAAMASFYFDGGCYALPDQMSFPVMFYRKDLLDGMGLNVPATWADLIELIPYLQRRNMEIYLESKPIATLGAAVSIGNSKAVNPVFLSLLYQRGGELYEKDGASSTIISEAGNTAFRKWTEFYTQHGFPLEVDFVTRFRIGEVPIGIVDLTNYSRLMVSAPEIRGAWAIAPVPGTMGDDDKIVYGAPCVTSAAMIVRNMAEKHGTAEESWSFLKWWTSGDTQTKYAREMESILGQAGRYPVANLKAFASIPWPQDIKPVLTGMLGTLRGVEQVPGGYITGRYLDTAFVKVITDYVNPSDTLYEYVDLINEEIAKKREEFGLVGPDGRAGGEP